MRKTKSLNNFLASFYSNQNIREEQITQMKFNTEIIFSKCKPVFEKKIINPASKVFCFFSFSFVHISFLPLFVLCISLCRLSIFIKKSHIYCWRFYVVVKNINTISYISVCNVSLKAFVRSFVQICVAACRIDMYSFHIFTSSMLLDVICIEM